MRPVFRPVAAAGLIAAGVLATSCTAPRPGVTFYGNRASVAVEPGLWCTLGTNQQISSCLADPTKYAHLTLGSGQPLQISVPGDLGAPWLVAFEYKDAAGKTSSGRSELFRDGRLAYTLQPPGAGTQLTRVEVQAGFVLGLDPSGATVFAATRTWVLVILPRPPVVP